MTTREVLIAARAKVAQGWTQGAYARDGSGNSRMPWVATCCSWCSIGALRAAPAGGGADAQDNLIDIVQGHLPGNQSLASWNDTPGRTQAEVLALFDAAIAACPAEAAP